MNKEELFLNRISLDFSRKYNFDLNKIVKFYNLKFDLSNLRIDSSNFDENINKDKRKKTGSYYTPDYIARYMVKNSLFNYFSINSNLSDLSLKNIFFNGKNNLNEEEMLEFTEIVSDIKISDFASGTGIFLLEYFTFIKNILISNDFDEANLLLKKIMKNNIYAYDINETALKIFSIKLNSLYFDIDNSKLIHINIYNVNTITYEKFDEITPKKGFDIVIGNPPYLGEKGNKKTFDIIRDTKFGLKYYTGKMDLLYYFIYRGINKLNEKGILIYLTTNYFVTADGAKELRKFIHDKGSILEILNFNSNKIFKSAQGLHSMILTFTKKKYNESKIINLKDKIKIGKSINKDTLSKYTYFIDKNDLFGNKFLIKLFINKEHYSIIKKIEKKSLLRIGDCFNVNQGLVSGADRVSKYSFNKKLSKKNISKYNININDSIFVLNDNEREIFKSKSYIKKFYKNSDIKRFDVELKTNKSILYIDNSVKLDDKLEKHLIPYKEILDRRREVKKGTRKWYELQWPRDNTIFINEKIVAPQRSISNVFGYTDKEFYGSADIYYITKKHNIYNYDLKILLGLLNSKLYYLYLSNVGKRKGRHLELYSTPIKNLLIKEVNNKKEIKKYVNKLINNFNDDDYLKLNRIIYEEFDLDSNEINFIEDYHRRI